MKGTKVKNTNTKPSFEEYYNNLSRPAKAAFKYGFLYALKMQKDAAAIKAILEK